MRPLRLVFVDGRPVRWDPARDVARGGITTALLALTKELARRGHQVQVVADVDDEAVSEKVHFVPRRRFAALAEDGPVDVLVAVPDLVALALPLPARARVAWTGNAFAAADCLVTSPWHWQDGIGKAGRVARLIGMAILGEFLSAVVAKSQWQADQLAATTGLDRRLFRVIGNGVPLEHYPAQAAPAARLVYTSQPRRGLDLLLELLPAIRAQVPEVTVDVYGYDTLDEGLARAAAAQHVAHHGALNKQQLAGELARGGVLAYPNTLRETFCTAVAEAQAAGLPIVTSRCAALEERVRHGYDGYLVDGDPRSRGYAEEFVAATVALLRDPQHAAQLGGRGRARALQEYAWPALTDRWEQLLDGLASSDVQVPPAGLLDLDTDQVLHDRGHTSVVPAASARLLVAQAVQRYGLDARRLVV